MNYKKAVLLFIFSLFLSGCHHNNGYIQLEPPRENALGKEVLQKGGLGSQIVHVNENNIEESSGANSVTKKEFSKFKSAIDTKIKGATAKLGYENTSSSNLTINDVIITQVKDFDKRFPINKKFIYKCMSATDYTFKTTKVGGIDVTIDATALAEKLGVDSANITFNNIPDSPDEKTIKINNPKVCFRYVAAEFDQTWRSAYFSDKFVLITGEAGEDKYSSNFNLGLGEESHRRTPQFLGIELAHKPIFRLKAITQNNLIHLAYCREDGETGEFKCSPLQEDGYGNWKRTYLIDTIHNKDIYKVIKLDVDAKRTLDGTVQVNSAKLLYPEYELIIN